MANDWYEMIKSFEPKGYLTDKGYVGYLPLEKDNGRERKMSFETEDAYVDFIRNLKIIASCESGE